MTKVDNLPSKFKENVDLVVDSGETNLGAASTIIKVEDEDIKILREGPISKERIEEIC